MPKKETKVYESAVIDQDGNVLSSRSVYRVKDEPPFVKLYLDCVCVSRGLSTALSPIALCFLNYMTYADETEKGAQMIFVNKQMKEIIAKKCGKGLQSINKALDKLVEADIFKRVARGTYQVNPYIFGRGDWVAIQRIRAQFDYSADGVKVSADIVREEEEKTDTAEKTIEEETTAKLLKAYAERSKKSNDNSTATA